MEILKLSKNQISDISPLAKINFQELEDLFLDQNKIGSIDALLNMNCKNLKKLRFEKIDLIYLVVLRKIMKNKLLPYL